MAALYLMVAHDIARDAELAETGLRVARRSLDFHLRHPQLSQQLAASPIAAAVMGLVKADRESDARALLQELESTGWPDAADPVAQVKAMLDPS